MNNIKVELDFSLIKRANDNTKTISFKARSLLAYLLDLIDSSNEGMIFVRHDRMRKITEVTSTQHICRLLAQLSEIISYKYHVVTTVDNKECFFGYTVKRK